MAKLSRRKHKPSWLARLVVPVIALIFFSYFGYHTVHGDLGLAAQEALEQELVLARARLDVVVSQRTALQHQVTLLSAGTVERDTLERFSRQMLNSVRDDELIVFRTAKISN